MNILSMLSIMVSTMYLVAAGYSLIHKKQSKLNSYSVVVLLCLAVWNFCDGFFFSSRSVEEAWLWHHLSALGFVCFIPSTTHYFMCLTHNEQYLNRIWKKAIFYALPTILLIYNLFCEPTSYATKIMVSSWNGQWTYVNELTNVWMILYVLCFALYFTMTFTLLFRWRKRIMQQKNKKLALSFIRVDAITIVLGVVTNFLNPIFGWEFPPIANLMTIIFGLRYFFIIIEQDIFSLSYAFTNQSIIENSLEPMAITDEIGEIVDANEVLAKTLGKKVSDLIGTTLVDYFDEGTNAEQISDDIWNRKEIDELEVVYQSEDGSKKKFVVSGISLSNPANEYLGTLFTFSDVTKISDLKDTYEKLAFCDTLTGLPNRRSVFDQIKLLQRNYEKTGKDFFVLYLDVNHFKNINDQYGHDLGDHFLIAVSERLKKGIHDHVKYLGRLGGDEFLMIGYGECTQEIEQESIQQIISLFDEPIVVNGNIFDGGVSIGLASYSKHLDIDLMVNDADQKMYLYKMNCRKCRDV